MKYSQALHAIEQCACVWVVEGISVRDLSLKESIAARNEQSRTTEPLAFAELPGILYKPSESGQKSTASSRELVKAANLFASSGV